LFTNYENILSCEQRKHETSITIYSSECSNFNGLDSISPTCKSFDACNAVSKFLNHLQGNHNDTYAENGFKYMYYWLYVDVLKRKVKHYDTIKLYKELIDKYEEKGWHLFEKCKNLLNEKNSENLIKLFTLYKYFNKVEANYALDKEKCKYAKECADTYMRYIGESHICDDKDFCSQLEKFRVKFNNHLTSIEYCDELKEFPPFQVSSLSATISLPVSVMSIISLFSFITYKVASWINPKLMKKKRSINELLQETENIENNSNGISYNIAYNLSE
ncbi:hypothetical protein PCYB_005290, partial [Plasmodium cynomolgi strain B]